MIGAAPAASQGTVSGDEIRARPLLRRGEVLGAIPGTVVTQHAGSGKANQYFLRNGDLSSAGSADFRLYDALPQNFATIELGEYNYWRTAIGNTFNIGQGDKAPRQ